MQTENVLEKVVMVLISFKVYFLFCFYPNEWCLLMTPKYELVLNSL